jgi:hypothetical protein
MKNNRRPYQGITTDNMNKIRNFVNTPVVEFVLGAITMILFFVAFYKVMWIASAIGILN